MQRLNTRSLINDIRELLLRVELQQQVGALQQLVQQGSNLAASIEAAEEVFPDLTPGEAQGMLEGLKEDHQRIVRELNSALGADA